MYTSPSADTKPSQDPVVDVTAVEQHDAWKWGWTSNAEIWNGRLAMIGFFMVFFAVLVYS